MQKRAISLIVSAIVTAMSTAACTHALQVKNLDIYARSTQLVSLERPITIAVLPYQGNPDGLFYFNTMVDRMNQALRGAEVRTDYIAGKPGRSNPDLIVSINPHVEYRSSGWNFLINWPGFIIFTPAWNGYVYYADIMTEIAIHDGNGNLLSTSRIPVSYSIRQAEMDRTIWTGLTWLEVSALALIGGIYNAAVFDRDIIGQLENHVRDNYGTFVVNQVQSKIRAAEDTLRAQPGAEEGSAEESSTKESGQDGVVEPTAP